MSMNLKRQGQGIGADLFTAFVKAFATREYLRQEEKGDAERAAAIKSRFKLTDLDIELLRK